MLLHLIRQNKTIFTITEKTMKKVVATIEGVSIVSFSKYIPAGEPGYEKLPRENAEQWDRRFWREKAHYNGDGNVILTDMMIKNCLIEATKYMPEKVPGQGRKQWGGFFAAGLIVPAGRFELMYGGEYVTKDNLIHKDELVGKQDKKIPARYPSIPPGWSATGEIWIIENIISTDIVEKYMTIAGNFVGLGRWRAGKGGPYGRFKVVDFIEEDLDI